MQSTWVVSHSQPASKASDRGVHSWGRPAPIPEPHWAELAFQLIVDMCPSFNHPVVTKVSNFVTDRKGIKVTSRNAPYPFNLLTSHSDGYLCEMMALLWAGMTSTSFKCLYYHSLEQLSRYKVDIVIIPSYRWGNKLFIYRIVNNSQSHIVNLYDFNYQQLSLWEMLSLPAPRQQREMLVAEATSRLWNGILFLEQVRQRIEGK